MQVSIGESKTRESAEEYLKIEENTEYLTHVIRYSQNKRRVYLRPDVHLPELRSIAALSVQISYLLFTCYVKQVTVLISQNFLLVNPQKKEANPSICCEYILEKDFFTLKEEEQKIVNETFLKHEFSTSEMWTYGRYTLNYIRVMLELAKPQFDKLKIHSDRMLAKQFMNLESIKTFLQTRLQTIEHPRIVILSLEESEVFREYSILVKVMNNSIFSMIKNSKNRNIFADICVMEQNLARSRDKNKTFLEAYSLEIESTIEQLLRSLIKYQIISMEISINNNQQKGNSEANKGNLNPNYLGKPKMGTQGSMQKMEMMPQQQPQMPQMNQNQSGAYFNNVNKGNQKQYVLGEIDQSTNHQRRYICRVHSTEKQWRNFTPKVYETLKFQALNNYNCNQNGMQEESDLKQKNKDPKQPQPSKNQFMIEFMPVKGLLIVKYITPIQLSIENTDLVMFQCNNIAYHWSQVSMELVEKSPNKLIKKKERYLALKTITHLHIADRPLFKLLLMLDLVMLCAKIAEPELKKNIIKAEDYNRVEQISLKVNHMINLFIRKIERYYKILAESQSNKSKIM